MKKLVMPCEIFSRVTGYFRPISNWNDGKREEFNDRVAFNEKKSIASSKEMEALAVH